MPICIPVITLEIFYFDLGEPNDAGWGEDCTEARTDGKWNDLPCAGYSRGSICEVGRLGSITRSHNDKGHNISITQRTDEGKVVAVLLIEASF